MNNTFINEPELTGILDGTSAPSKDDLSAILQKGRALQGLTPDEAALLIAVKEDDQLETIFKSAAYIKEKIYGDRLVFFAPLYLSNYCVNDCDYCGFHTRNKSPRKKLTLNEVREQTACIVDMGHKRVLLEAGEDERSNPIGYILEAIDAIYSVKRPGGEIRRINVNIAATTVENYRRLKEKEIGTYQLFQETYHRPTYEKLHSGPKGDYERQLYALDNAFEAGIDDVGLGVLFGLYDWRFEVLSLITHANYLQEKFGVGPHTLSVPRFRPADSVDMKAPCPVSDEEFLKLIAILRIAVPYAGMIITTREDASIRSRAFRLGVTQASAASSTSPGGFGDEAVKSASQFELSDKRSLDEVALAAMKEGFTPSFCTACYRKSRTGETFMELAKPGHIHEFCQPNSILTLMEYIEDHASDEGRKLGMEMIEKELDKMKDNSIKKQTRERLAEIKKGERDLYF